MKKLLTSITVFALLIGVSACSQPTETPDGITIPQQEDPNAESKVEIHNKIANGTYEMGDKIRSTINQIKLYHTEGQEEKPTAEDLQKTYQEIFNKSEEVRKLVTEDFKDQTVILESFENTYMPALDNILSKLEVATQSPENKETFDEAAQAFDEYYTAHNNFTEVMNENIFY